MNKAKVMRKAEAGEGLTVAEIKVYQKAVKPEKHVYGKYGTLAKQYLEDNGIDDHPLRSSHFSCSMYDIPNYNQDCLNGSY